MSGNDKGKVNVTMIDLTREQLFAILRDTDGGPIWIERTQGKFTHTYVQDKTLKAENRCAHVSVKGKFNVCEGTING